MQFSVLKVKQKRKNYNLKKIEAEVINNEIKSNEIHYPQIIKRRD